MSGGQSNTITGSAILTTGGSGDLDTTDTDPSSNITITLVISNLHCSSCATTIHLLLAPLTPPPTAISTNIVTHEVTIEHVAALSTNEILRVLLEAGFKVDSITVSGVCVTPSPHTGGLWGGRVTSINNIHTLTYENLPPEDWGESIKIALQSGKSHERHVEVCEVCRSKEHKRASGTPLSPSSGTPQWGNAVSNASVLFMDRPGGGSADSAGESSKSPGYGGAADEKSLIHYADASYSAPATPSNMFEKGQTSPLSPRSTSNIAPHNTSSTEPRSAMASPERPAALQTEVVFPVAVTEMQVPDIILNVAPATALFEATFSIEGMTCSACTGKVNDTVGHLPGVKSVNVALMTNSATIEFEGVKEDAAKIVDEIEDIGYGCMLESIKELNSDGAQTKIVERVVQIRIEGMFCESCPTRVIEALQTFGDAIKVGKPLTIPDPIVQISYLAAPPDFTIRHIISTLNAVDPAFSASIYQPPTIEERSRHIQRTELRRLILRAILCIIIAIPTFLIGIVWMSLVPKNDRMRRYFAKQMWAGQVTRLEWALFFLSTPVQFFVADVFHVRAYKEIKALWRPGSQVPILRRFYRFGSMNLLISLGVSIAYFASVGLLATAATRKGESKGPHTTYFDSTVFLTMFLLIGRCLEAYSKIKTSDAVSMLGKLRPTEALLLEPEGPPATPHSASTGSLATKEHASPTVNKIPVDMLEVGDTIIVQHGGSPPADGKLSQGETKFDESSLTGEARPVQKKEGDVVFAGTINKGKAVRVVVDAVSGESMLDQIVKVVREGQTRRAPIERVADMLTGYFVPVVTLIAISTWVIWLSLGMSGVLPDYWLDVDEGSWPVWSLGFAIAVFVVACPCGIGLAAPTALFVGSGLAAKYGILAKGGGEAFQEASWLDVVVFDKTGTLTEGGEPKVTDEEVFVDTVGRDEEGVLGLELEVRKLVYAFAIGLEEMSSHPLARAVVSHCEPQERANVTGSDVEEVPGRGLRGVFTINNTSDSYEAIIGNEAFMTENGVAELKDVTSSLLHSWKSRGKSVVLFAIKPRPNTTTLPCFTQETFTLTAAFAAADPLRSEAPYVVKNLRASGISVWMISGDNPVTATAVADMVGIPRENVIAGVLPTQKAEKIQYLQTYAPKRRRRTWYGKTKAANPRAIVAMVGDGINDAPALAVSDVGVAIGSGSDVAIGSAKFILVSSNLCSLFTLIELSRKVFRRVKFNFFWACVYNLIALPVAAGVLYPVGMREYNAPSAVQSHGVSHNGIQMNMDGDGPRRIRLEPVWASLAMALSSVSVVCSSLLLRTKWYGVGFRPSMMAMKASPGEDPEEQRDINIDEVV
ncbi:E1-E2 ATPase-domain-containing protein [Tirmania nivea]|nr:E1-E2 ATPase-domain-containing protein [Tirmania nivea]